LIVRITQLDGKLPNLALMRLSAWHRAQGDDVRWERGTSRQLHEPAYDAVYGSAIFGTSAKAVALFRQQFPEAIVGGSGGDAALRVEDIVPSQFTGLDYGGYPDFTASIGYAMRGCRFKCGFCVVPKQEGAPRSNASIAQIWRGPGFPKHLHLLDNDFFGNPDWRSVVEAINGGGFKVCINQGINVRLLDDEAAAAMASMRVMDDQFKTRRIYTAWDNIGDEGVFFRGVDLLEKHGVNPDNLMVYMLVGYDPRETWERILHRYTRMMERKVRPYPMVHDRFRQTKPDLYRKLKQFQGWIIRGTHKTTPFEEFNRSHKPNAPEGGLLEKMAATVAKNVLAEARAIQATGARVMVVEGPGGWVLKAGGTA
jgi:hypothetical protein